MITKLRKLVREWRESAEDLRLRWAMDSKENIREIEVLNRMAGQLETILNEASPACSKCGGELELQHVCEQCGGRRANNGPVQTLYM